MSIFECRCTPSKNRKTVSHTLTVAFGEVGRKASYAVCIAQPGCDSCADGCHLLLNKTLREAYYTSTTSYLKTFSQALPPPLQVKNLANHTRQAWIRAGCNRRAVPTRETSHALSNRVPLPICQAKSNRSTAVKRP